MATTIEKQTALDESLVPNSQRAFQVTADVPEIYMQEFWATAKLHHTSIRFKIDIKKSVLNLEAFREMLHISPRIPNQPFADLPTEEEVLDFLRSGKGEGTASKPGVPDVPSDDYEEELSNEMKNSNQASMSNQTNELKNMMASFFQMNTASTSGLGHLPSNTIANPKGELKAITTQSGIVLDGPSISIPPLFINPEEDERVEETLTGQDLAEYTIKIPPPFVQKSKPPSLRNFAVHQRDTLHLNIP
nr:reverse transcriptase domain-containing protein [Tanacetum cinerariifolium]